ncbi:MAG TPA: hypothetical protein DCO83_07475 [Mucilaginibacter sp.]|jgi:hypothetical protein|nr:hypothetical protein [Mucilaginibacter sp.]
METQQNEIHLTGKEGGEFDLDLAASWTKNYRDKHPGETVSHFFGKDILQKILAQEGCQGIRFYYAHSKPLSAWQRSMVSLSNFLTKVAGNIESEKHLIIVGAGSDGKDQIDVELVEALSRGELKSLATHKTYMVGDQSSPCPGSPGCPTSLLAGS